MAPVRGKRVMVVSDEPLANAAGVEIMKRGGNAVDAGVAVAFALAVVEPAAGNIGGGGFMLVRLHNGRTAFVDYREKAPLKATRDMYAKASGPPAAAGNSDEGPSLVGYRAVAVPGTVAGLTLSHEKFGTMKLADVMAPAIRLAEEGFLVSERLADSLEGARTKFTQFAVSRRTFLKGGEGYKAGEIFRQPELAATLRRIAKNGPDEFYRGETAKHLAADMEKNGGLITLEDLAGYEPRVREPLRATYMFNGHQWGIITSPRPSSGGIAMIEALNILEPIQLKGWDDAESVHWVIEAMRRVFADRAAWLADPDFAHVPVAGLTNREYAAKLRATIDLQNASSSKEVSAGDPSPFDAPAGSATYLREPPLSREEAEALMLHEASRAGHTTHFSVVDAAGNAVANTYTINVGYGSGVTSPDGFLLNNEMDDFAAHPGQPNVFGLIQSEANTIGPSKRPLSSMVPTIVLRDGKLSFVTGSPGGPTIISAALLSVLNWTRLGMDAQQAINAPRFHQQWMPDVVAFEPIFPDATVKLLEQRGYHVSSRRPWLGQVEAIGIDSKTGERLGAPDARRIGAAAGY